MTDSSLWKVFCIHLVFGSEKTQDEDKKSDNLLEENFKSLPYSFAQNSSIKSLGKTLL